MTLGALSKRHAAGEADHHACFRTTYLPWLFAVTNKESKETYDFFFEQAAKVASTCCAGLDLEDACKQYHGYWHKGEEQARAARFSKSLRAADYAHFVGATTRSKKTIPVDDDHVMTWRTGVYHTLEKNHATTNAIQLLRDWLPILRKVPTLMVFHTLTHYLFQALTTMGQEVAAKILQTHYFSKRDSRVARDSYGMKSWIGDPAFVWYAYWWCGYQRLQPGSASGSQA